MNVRRSGELVCYTILCRIILQNTNFNPPAVTVATCWLHNEVGANITAYLIRHILEALNSQRMGLANVWQLDTPSWRS